MTERLTYQDLDRDELLALLERRVVLISQADLLWAKWEVNSQRAIDAFKEYMAATEETHRTLVAYTRKRNSKSLADLEAAQAKEKRLRAKHGRLDRLERDLFRRHRETSEPRS